MGEENCTQQSSLSFDLYTIGEYMRGKHMQWLSTHETLMPRQLMVVMKEVYWLIFVYLACLTMHKYISTKPIEATNACIILLYTYTVYPCNIILQFHDGMIWLQPKGLALFIFYDLGVLRVRSIYQNIPFIVGSTQGRTYCRPFRVNLEIRPK